MPPKTSPTRPPRERAFIVGVEIESEPSLLPIDESLAELTLLADTAGLDVVGQTYQKRDRPHSKTFIGSGKVEEIRAILPELRADVLLFDEELSPRHQRELEKIFQDKIRVLDRTALILDIFAQHASTREGSLQVQLAQYEYRLPRLTRAWTHLARQAGGVGGKAGVGLRGPGETQLEVDRRDISRRIDHLKRELDKVRAHRERHRARRRQTRMPVVAIVGYTNAGKSTLLNYLTRASVYVADQLFATLDPTTRRVELPGGNVALLTDTVGFIQKLPTQLIAAFRATLEEITEADLLLHIVDVTHPSASAQAEAVLGTLEEIGAGHIPVITALNKIDRLAYPEQAIASVEGIADTLAISALTGLGIPGLMAAINVRLYESYEEVTVLLPFQEGALLAQFHDLGRVERVVHTRRGILLQGRLPGRLLAQYQPFIELAAEPEDEPGFRETG